MIDAGEGQHRLVAELVEHRVAEDVAEERGDQRVTGSASGTVAHRDRVLTEQRLALPNLGDALEHPLFGVGDASRRRLDRGPAPGLDDDLGHRARTGMGRTSCSAIVPLPLPSA